MPFLGKENETEGRKWVEMEASPMATCRALSCAPASCDLHVCARIQVTLICSTVPLSSGLEDRSASVINTSVQVSRETLENYFPGATLQVKHIK